jgi:hypothetical protein
VYQRLHSRTTKVETNRIGKIYGNIPLCSVYPVLRFPAKSWIQRLPCPQHGTDKDAYVMHIGTTCRIEFQRLANTVKIQEVYMFCVSGFYVMGYETS